MTTPRNLRGTGVACPAEPAKPADTRSGWLSGRPVLRTLALILSVSMAPSCNEEPAPVATAKKFASAVQRNDVKSMLELVDEQTAAYIEQSAERASDQIGGRRNVQPDEMLQIVDVDQRFAVAKAELIDMNDVSATVKLIGADGTEHTLELVQEEDGWRVRVPLPTGRSQES